jgi:hypothetical protein
MEDGNFFSWKRSPLTQNAAEANFELSGLTE